MENEEVTQLRELKEKLVKKAIHLKDRLKDREENGRRESIDFNALSTVRYHDSKSLASFLPFLDNCSMLSFDDEGPNPSGSLSARYKTKLCEITGQVTGITFKDIDRKWLRDNVYMYTAKVITKTISFNVNLTVTLQVRKENY